MVEIEKDVPMPDTARHGNTKYPWAQLEIGHSFLSNVRSCAALTKCRQDAERRTGFKFATFLDKSKGRVRVWRIA